MALEIYKALSHTHAFDPRNSAAGSGERHADGGFHAGEENIATHRVWGPGSPAAAKPWGRHSFASVVTPKSKCLPLCHVNGTCAARRQQDGTWTPRAGASHSIVEAGNLHLCIHEFRDLGNVQ